jgi:Tfp pilus assembly PilM family ATPase
MKHLQQLLRFWPRPRAPHIGLDLDTDALSMVLLGHQPQPNLLGYTQVSLPAHDKPDEPGAETAHLSTAIHQAWRALDTPVTQVALALPAAQVRYCILSVPRLPSNEIEAFLEAEACDLLDAPLNTISMDFQPIAPHPDMENTDEQQILMGATLIEPLSLRIRAVEQAGLQVTRLEVDVFALMAASASQKAWQSARFGRRLLLHATRAQLSCHTIQAGALLPDQPARHFSNQSADDVIAAVMDAQVAAIYFAGCSTMRTPLQQALQQHPYPLELLGHTFASSAQFNDETLATDTPALTLAYGLALGGSHAH